MPAPQRYAFGDFVLERSQHRLRHLDGTPLNLTPRVFGALLLFVENPGDLLTKDALLLALWPGLVVEENKPQPGSVHPAPRAGRRHAGQPLHPDGAAPGVQVRGRGDGAA